MVSKPILSGGFLLIASVYSTGILAAQTTEPRQSIERTTTERDSLPPALRLRALVLGEAGGEAADAPTVNIPTEFRALFCRFDDDLDERKIPLRMRVGDLETVNRAERKPGW